MKNTEMKINVGISAHGIKQLEVTRECIDLFVKKVNAIPETYCENDGERLEYIPASMYTSDGKVLKRCPKCGEQYAFHKPVRNSPLV